MPARSCSLLPAGCVEAQPARIPFGLPLLFALISAALLVPCFWQPHIQAGDLSSHLYNAWLSRQVAAGQLPGLVIVSVWTNVLSDWVLSALMGVLNPTWTARMFVSYAVLIFFWGAFFFLRRVTNQLCWWIAPILAMLTYGLIFHFGFFNFYLSTGLSLWLMAILWRPSWKRAAWAVPLAVLAYMGHAMPLLWAAAVLGYVLIARNAAPWLRLALPVAAAAALAGMNWLLKYLYAVRSTNLLPGLGITGADQTWLFGPKYLIVSLGLMAIWSLLLMKRIDQGAFWSDPLTQLWILHMVAFLLLPDAIRVPQYLYPLSFIPQRISLFISLLICAIIANVRAKPMVIASTMLMAVYFAFICVDSRAHNLVEERISGLVAKLPPGQRVVAVLTDPGSPIQNLLHVVDRACIGHCFSYGNYEPASKAFRLRAIGPNPYVAASTAEVEIEEGTHVVTPQEAPIYAVCRSGPNLEEFCLRQLAAGDRICAFSLRVSPQLVGELKREERDQPTSNDQVGNKAP
jgi:hypothetical protein